MKLFIFMGVSGSGKSTIQHSLPIKFLTNYTTRPLRKGEVDGHHINYVSYDKFIELKNKDFFFEINEYSNHLYGTPKDKLGEVLKGTPYHCTKDINGARKLKKLLDDKAVVIYIKAPSIEVIKNRMVERGDSKDDIDVRISNIYKTNELEDEKYADHIILNDDLDESILEAHKIIIRELVKGVSIK